MARQGRAAALEGARERHRRARCCPTPATTAITAAARTTATRTSKDLLVHHQVIVPITDGRLDLGPWQAIFSAEFDGGRDKRLVIKVLGEKLAGDSPRGSLSLGVRPGGRRCLRHRSWAGRTPGRGELATQRRRATNRVLPGGLGSVVNPTPR